jgi:hypothetical protein
MKRKAKRVVPNFNKQVRHRIPIGVRIDDGLGTSMPPSLASIEIYFDQKGVVEIAGDFFTEHELREWKSATGHSIINWKVCAADWIYDYRQAMKIRFRKSPFYKESS